MIDWLILHVLNRIFSYFVLIQKSENCNNLVVNCSREVVCQIGIFNKPGDLENVLQQLKACANSGKSES